MSLLYQEYDEEVLKRLQATELTMLADFIEICNKNDIDYFAMGGTAIGAVRHKGFIPWDDDIDIAMTRDNFDRFLEIAQKECSDRYDIVNAQTTPEYPLMSTRWILKGTKFKEECFKDLDINLGIFLDLYCWDNLADNEFLMKCQARTAWMWSKFMILRSIKKPVLYFGGFKASLVYFICAVVHYSMKILHISPEFLYRRAIHAATKYNNQETKRVGFLFDTSPYMSMMKLNDIIPTQIYEYSGLKVKFPRDIWEYLNVTYGSDCMTIPPVDKRHNHPPYELQFLEE